MDSLDRDIVARLQQDGRASYARLGQAVGLSVAATKRRVDRLVRDGMIQGFTAVVSPRAVGWQLEALVHLYTNGTVPFATMRDDIEQLPEVLEAFTVTGPADAVLRVAAADVDHLERVIGRLRGLAYVQQTDSTVLLSTLRPQVAGAVTASREGSLG